MNGPVLLNYTPHDVHLYGPDGKTLLHTWGRQATPVLLPLDIDYDRKRPPLYTGGVEVPLVDPPTYGDLTWPDISELTTKNACGLIVSQLVGERTSRGTIHGGAFKLYTPDTGPESVVRDAEGRIIGCRRLISWG